MADDDMFYAAGGEPTPEQLQALMKAEQHNMTFPVCLALRAMGLGHMEDHLHNVTIFKFPSGQFVFAFGWCQAAHVDTDNLTPEERAGMKALIRALLEMHGATVIEEGGRLFTHAGSSRYQIAYPGGELTPPVADIDAEVDRFRLELDRDLGTIHSHKDLPPEDPMKRWMP